MKTTTLTEAEERTAKGYKRKAQEILIQAKSESVLFAAKNVPIEVIADFADRKPSTVARWLSQ
jgi:hypothetical protein